MRAEQKYRVQIDKYFLKYMEDVLWVVRERGGREEGSNLTWVSVLR